VPGRDVDPAETCGLIFSPWLELADLGHHVTAHALEVLGQDRRGLTGQKAGVEDLLPQLPAQDGEGGARIARRSESAGTSPRFVAG
jgi:hypothetical protein